MGDGVARRIEPAAASRRMKPALAMLTLRIFAVEQIIGPFGIRHPVVRPRPLDMALAAAAEFDFRARAAKGTVDQRSEERRVGKECARTWISRWSRVH